MEISFESLTGYLDKLETLTSKKQIASLLVETISSLLHSSFVSFVEETDTGLLNVLSQCGSESDIEHVQNLFNEELSHELYSFVTKKGEITLIKVGKKDEFIFVPVICNNGQEVNAHGIFVCHIKEHVRFLSKNLFDLLKIFAKFSGIAMSNIQFSKRFGFDSDVKQEVLEDFKLTYKLQKSFSDVSEKKRYLCTVLDKPNENFDGHFWWMSELNDDILLVLIAQIFKVKDSTKQKGLAASMLTGYILGEMNYLKKYKPDIIMRPKETLTYLNQKLHRFYVETEIALSAWFGLINLSKREIVFANANHPHPFIIGPEQQVSYLMPCSGKKDPLLGINLSSEYFESSSFIPVGSKLVICTQSLLEQAARVGDKYDASWLPQVLETIGTLPITEMKDHLDKLLSGTKSQKSGTGVSSPRLALLMELESL